MYPSEPEILRFTVYSDIGFTYTLVGETYKAQSDQSIEYAHDRAYLNRKPTPDTLRSDGYGVTAGRNAAVTAYPRHLLNMGQRTGIRIRTKVRCGCGKPRSR